LVEDISDTAYRIAITLEVTNEHGDATEPPTILLNISYPDTYPDVAPNLDLSNPPNAPKHPLFDVSEDKFQLLQSLGSTIEENLGMAMIFTLVSTLKESAEQLIVERQGALQAQKDQKAAEADEEENRKFHGTVVTRERFVEWREKFREEMAERERKDKEEREVEDKKKRAGKVEEKKMSGRQLWEKGLVGKVDEEEEGGEEAVEGMERLKVAE
jgi:RWD domain